MADRPALDLPLIPSLLDRLIDEEPGSSEREIYKSRTQARPRI